MNNAAHIIGDRLKDLLVKNNLNQSELAEKANVTRAAISQIIHGERMPTIPLLRRLAQELSVNIDYLVGSSDKPDVELVLKNDPNQLEFFRNFQNLDPAAQEMIKKAVKGLMEKD